MTDTPQDTTGAPARKRGGGLNSMLLAELKSMAGGLGVKGAGSMKKAQLVDAIKAAQSGGPSGGQSGGPSGSSRTSAREEQPAPATDEPRRAADQPTPVQDDGQGGPGGKEPSGSQADHQSGDRSASAGQPSGPPDGQPSGPANDTATGPQGNRGNRGNRDNRDNQDNQDNQDTGQSGQGGHGGQGADDGDADADGEGGSRRNRRRRGRDRTRTTATGGGQSGGQGGQSSGQPGQGGQADGKSGQGGQPGNQGGNQSRNEPDTTILDDDVLVPAAGILDVLDNYAFVRTSGYLPGVDDVYLSLSMVRKFGLRRGDALVGQVRQPREGERKEKFNPMVRIDSVNGADPETARHRPDFATLTPVHPDQRLRLETAPDDVVGRVVDLAAPLGKGQRCLLVSPSRSGKTSVLRSIAASVTRNNPECHLMVVLVDERPEEVTDFQRSVKGEVVASTFDRPPADHTVVAELAIERAKRLVELGHDVVVLIDGLTRLARAYNLSAPAGGRATAGGIDTAALFPPKRFFGAARNLEDGGSLTIVATATVESGTPLDELILDELSDAANCELRLSRDLARTGVFPPVDLAGSSTRAVDRLVGREELAILDKLRRVLSGMDDVEAADLLLERVRGSQTNVELLTRVQRAAPNVV